MNFLPNVLHRPIDGRSGSPLAESPARVVVDSVNTSQPEMAFQSYSERRIAPHITLDPYTQEVWQHIDFGLSAVGVTALPIEPHKMGKTIWVMVLKTSQLSEEQAVWLGEKVGQIQQLVGADNDILSFPSEFSVEYRRSTLSMGLWRRFRGICGAAHVPHADSNGPGEIDSKSFLEGVSLVHSPFEGKHDTPDTSDTSTVRIDSFAETTEIAEPMIIEEALSPTLGKFPGRKVKAGSSGKAVSALRKFYGLGDGNFDEDLDKLVCKAQRAAGLKVNGVVDRETWEAIEDFSKVTEHDS